MKVALPLMLVVLTVMKSGAQDAAETEHAYIGSKKCKKCHLKQYKSWAETKMANAFELLKPGGDIEEKTAAGLDPEKDYTTDEKCLPCHVTGYGQDGGFVDIETTPNLAGVGCEMCHGAGGTYSQDQYMSTKNKKYIKANIVAVGMVDTVSEDQCVVCHNTDSPFVGDDYVFDFEKRRSDGSHKNFELKHEH